MLRTLLIGSLTYITTLNQDFVIPLDSGYLTIEKPKVDYNAFILKRGGTICIVKNELYILEPIIMNSAFNPSLSISQMEGTKVYEPHTIFNPDNPQTNEERVFLARFENNNCLKEIPRGKLYVDGLLMPARKVGKIKKN